MLVSSHLEINLRKVCRCIISFAGVSERMSTTSALYQLNYGVLCDILVFNPSFNKEMANSSQGPVYQGSAEYYLELPTEWALSQERFTSKEHLWVLILKDYKGRWVYPYLKLLC